MDEEERRNGYVSGWWAVVAGGRGGGGGEVYTLTHARTNTRALPKRHLHAA